MASAAEQLAANLNFSSFAKADDLKKRIWFTLGALIIYRLGTFIPLPGIDPLGFAAAFSQAQQGIIGLFNVFSGGAVERMAIFALSIMPYISASIIVQLLTAVVPQFAALKKEGEQGRKKINQYTRLGTVALAIVQSYGIAVGLETNSQIVPDPGLFFRFTTVVTLTGGTVFLMWLGEQITSRGVGNGISLIIFAGIVAQLPFAFVSLLELGRSGTLSTALIILTLILVVVIVVVIVFFERAQRRLPVQHPKRQIGNKMTQGQSSHLPLKLNSAGVIPPIFASSLLMLPITVSAFSAQSGGGGWLSWVNSYIGPGHPLYLLLYGGLIMFFAFFYTAIVFNPEDTADNLKQRGGFIPGVRPGKQTAHYIDYVLTRITVIGAIYLMAVCLLPQIMIDYTGIPFRLGGTSLLIVVSVTMDTVTQIQSHLIAHQYEGLIKKSRLRRDSGRKR